MSVWPPRVTPPNWEGLRGPWGIIVYGAASGGRVVVSARGVDIPDMRAVWGAVLGRRDVSHISIRARQRGEWRVWMYSIGRREWRDVTDWVAGGVSWEPVNRVSEEPK